MLLVHHHHPVDHPGCTILHGHLCIDILCIHHIKCGTQSQSVRRHDVCMIDDPSKKQTQSKTNLSSYSISFAARYYTYTFASSLYTIDHVSGLFSLSLLDSLSFILSKSVVLSTYGCIGSTGYTCQCTSGRNACCGIDNVEVKRYMSEQASKQDQRIHVLLMVSEQASTSEAFAAFR